VAHAVRTWSGVPGEKVVVIPNAIDVETLAGIVREPAAGGRYRVGFIGRLDPVKRVPDLVRAVAMLPGDVELHVYGEGRERGRIEQEIRRAGAGGRVVMHGAVAGPAEALGRVDVLVLPSEAEGFGLVLIEAMAAGVPVVATDVAGIRDVVQDGRNGVLVPAGSPADLAGGIERVRNDAELRRRIVSDGRAGVVQRYSWDGVMRLYRQLLGLAVDRSNLSDKKEPA
jgi:glycosyltransferase involved in cell wall biosynthesis